MTYYYCGYQYYLVVIVIIDIIVIIVFVTIVIIVTFVVVVDVVVDEMGAVAVNFPFRFAKSSALTGERQRRVQNTGKNNNINNNNHK